MSALLRQTVIGGPANEYVAPVAIAAFDHAAFVDFQPDAWMAQCGGNAFAAAVAGDAVGSDKDGFRRFDHAEAVSKAVLPRQRGSYW